MKIKNNSDLIPYDPVQELADKNFVRKAILECLKNDEFDGILEVVQLHSECINRKTRHKQE